MTELQVSRIPLPIDGTPLHANFAAFDKNIMQKLSHLSGFMQAYVNFRIIVITLQYYPKQFHKNSEETLFGMPFYLAF